MLQKVINYQYSILQTRTSQQIDIVKSSNTSQRFTPWNLPNSIRKIPQHQEFNVVWLGNDKISSIIAFFYCIASGSFQKCDKKGQYFTRLKHNLYQLSENHLNVSQKKLFVQYLCLLQYSKNIGQFLRKNHVFEDLLGKIFTSFKEKLPSKDVIQDTMEEIKLYSNIFDFVQFSKYHDDIGKIKIKNFIFFIIQEKQCLFILQKNNIHEMKKCFSQLNQSNIYQSIINSSKKKKKPQNTSSSRRNNYPFYQEPHTPKFHFSNSQKSFFFDGVPKIQEVTIQAFKQQSQEGSNRKDLINIFEKQNKINSVQNIPKKKYKDKKILTEQSTKSKIVTFDETIKKNLHAKQLFNSKKINLQKLKKTKDNFHKRFFHSIRNTVPQVKTPIKRVPKFLLDKKIQRKIRNNKTFPKLVRKKLNHNQQNIHHYHFKNMQNPQINLQNNYNQMSNRYSKENVYQR